MTGIISASLTLFSIQVGFPVAGILVGDYFLKNQKDKKIRYALGISAFAFGGWLLSNHITTKYLEDVEITLEAEESNNPKQRRIGRREIVMQDFEDVEQALLEWFDYYLVDTEPYAAKNSSTRIIGLDYTARPELVDSQGYDTGADPNDYGSAYPQLQQKPLVYEPMNDRAGLEEIAFDLENIWKECDGYYFISRDAYDGGPSEQQELVFYEELMGRRRPLFVFLLAKTHQDYFEAEEGETMLTVKDLTRLIVVIDTSASTMTDYKGRKFRIPSDSVDARRFEGKTTTDNSPNYSLGKKYHTMAKNMVKTLQPDDFVFLDWNGVGVTYYDENKQSYNGTGRLESVADFIKEQGLDKGDYITTTVIITDHPLTHGLLSPSLHKRT